MANRSRKIPYSKLILLFTTIIFIVACGTNTSEQPSEESARLEARREIDSASKFVAIDQGEAAFTVFTGISKTTDDARLDEIKEIVSNNDALTMLSWEEFLVGVDEYTGSVMLRDDYPDAKTVEGLICLIASEQGSGAPWGLTWQGGIALTFNDYEHVRRSYESYQENPDAYEPVGDPKGDPVNPAGHLGFAGCN